MNATQTLKVPGYQVMEFIGSGAKSTLWKIREIRTDKTFVLKRVVKRHANEHRFIDQAVNEYNIGSQLEHEGIRRIYHIRRLKRWLSLREVHLIMEYCDGYSLQERRPTIISEAVYVFSRVAEALAFMNARGFVHADTKPNNIIVAPGGSVKLIDFGQSCRIGTVKERIQGTPDFIAPEQVYRQPLDARTDVFNFGASLYWTLTGRAVPTILPKRGPTTLMAEMAVTPPEEINAEVPRPLSKLVCDCIERSPARRPSTMNEVASRLGLIEHTIHRNSNSHRPQTPDN